MRLLPLLLLAACTNVPPAPSSAIKPLVSTSRACTWPETFGAVTDDGQDDRVALQAAIVAAQTGSKCLELGPGTYHVTWVKGTDANASLSVTAPLELFGAGRDATMIVMFGTALSPTGAPRGWQLLDIVGDDVRVHDLSFDGSDRAGTSEQTHLIQVRAPSNRVTLEHLRLSLPPRGPSSGGDCIRLLGGGDNVAKVRDTTIKNVVGATCDRSFVSFQRGVEGVVIAESESILVDQAPIDFEPTGTSAWNCAPSIKDVLIRDSTFARGPEAPGAVTVSISGDGCSKAENITVERTKVLDGTLHLIDVKNVLLIGLDLKNRFTQAEPVFRVMKRAERVRLIDSKVERVAGSMPGNVVTVAAMSGAIPTDVQLDGVTVVQNVAGQPIEFLAGKSLLMNRVNCAYRGPAPAPASCTLVRSGKATLIDSTFKGTAVATRTAGTALVVAP